MLEDKAKRKTVLYPKDISALKNGFPRLDDPPDETAGRQWSGMPLADIAEKFSVQIGQKVTVRTIKYHYNQLMHHLNGNQNRLVPIVKGKKKSPAIKQATIIPSHASLVALTEIIWALTRFSIPDIYRLYSNVVENHKEWNLVAIQNFRKIIKELVIDGIKTTPSQNPMERHSLRVLLHTIKPTEELQNIWIVVAAIETLTGYINIRIFKTHEKPHSPSLSSTNIADFVKDTIERLALPIYRVELNGVTSEARVELVSNLLPAQQVIQGDADNQVAEYSIPDNLKTANRFCNFLSAAVNAHNTTTSSSKLISARKAIYDDYLLIKEWESQKNSWITTPIKLRHIETPIQPLRLFCKKYLKTDEAVNKVPPLSMKMLKLEILQLYSPNIPILASWRILRPFRQRRNHRINHAANPKDDPIQPQQDST